MRFSIRIADYQTAAGEIDPCTIRRSSIHMWQIEWRAISARIRGLLEAATFFIRTIQSGEHDQGTGGQELLRNGRQVVGLLRKFQNDFAAELSSDATICLTAFVTAATNASNSGHGLPAVQELMTVLSSYRAEFDYLVSDSEAISRSRVARAFTHLQRSIVVDTEFKRKWVSAFQEGEIHCEKLGAIHLLLHGIWAFKSSAEGERTDLVLGMPVEPQQARTAADAMVLTEWKLVRQLSEVDSTSRAALNQARRYSVGILAGFELASRRYLVLVSEGLIATPSAYQEGTVTYEYVNIAVNPSSPSRPLRN